MTSKYGLTPDQALARIMELDKQRDMPEVDRRRAYRSILTKVQSLAYHEGSEEERVGGWGA